ncbi:homoserine O-succinyltransferase [uncultured Methylovirgula sp.]|uniref:homoserine O-succinyltransferase MetA n=1 Tax=uncultured Methylovirgula sp. TaxID=1285960 RepID=UPI0026184742|nr:homoserine O-succinyltransferase [uncultured Methylovirgula sp.]
MTDQMQKEAEAAPVKGASGAPLHGGRGAAEYLEIGIVNNMPDATLAATERQFKDLIGQAALDMPVRLRFFALAEIARGEGAAEHIGMHYGDVETLMRGRLHGLIITGCEPKAASLQDEPYWPSLARIIDWAARNTRSTIFSCLAAHAAALHLDGIRRVPVGQKYSGVFDCAVLTDDPLTRGLGPDLRVPHSRLNDLETTALAACGYEILTASPRIGADIFVKRQESLFVFLQGHPEYDAESLLREYRRDVTRFLRGERPNFPAIPEDYFDPLIEKHLAVFAERAAAGKSPHPHRELASLLDTVRPDKTWRASAAGFYRNWLGQLTIGG